MRMSDNAKGARRKGHCEPPLIEVGRDPVVFCIVNSGKYQTQGASDRLIYAQLEECPSLSEYCASGRKKCVWRR